MLIMLHNVNKPVDFVLSGINKKAALPILRGVRIKQKGQKVTLVSTDLETESSVTIFDTDNTSQREDVDVVIKAEQLTRNSFTHRGFLPVHDDDFDEKAVSNFPTMKGRGNRKGARNISDAFPSIKTAANFCSKNELKPTLQGVHVTKNRGIVGVEASDGFTLYRNTVFALKWRTPDFDIIIPGSAIRQLTKMEKVFKTLTFEYNEKYLYVTGTLFSKAGSPTVNGKLIVRLIDEKFPNVDSVIPAESLCRKNKVALNVNTKEALSFVREIKKAASIGTDKDNPMVEFLGNGEVKTGPLTRKSPLSMNVPIRVGLNPNYLWKIIKNIKTDLFNWEFDGPGSASLLRPIIKGRNAGELFLLMPIRLKD